MAISVLSDTDTIEIEATDAGRVCCKTKRFDRATKEPPISLQRLVEILTPMAVSAVDVESWPSIGLLLVILLAGCVGVGGSIETPEDDAMTVTGPDRGTEGPNFEYIEANDTVRVVITRDNDGPVRTKILRFEEFAQFECLEVGLDAIRNRLTEAFGQNPSVGTGHNADAITVTYYPRKLLAPGKEKLQKALPDTVRVSIRIGPRNHTCDVPVNIEEGSQPIPA